MFFSFLLNKHQNKYNAFFSAYNEQKTIVFFPPLIFFFKEGKNKHIFSKRKKGVLRNG